MNWEDKLVSFPWGHRRSISPLGWWVLCSQLVTMWLAALLQGWYHIKSLALVFARTDWVIPWSALVRGSPCSWAMHGSYPCHCGCLVHGSIVHVLRWQNGSFQWDEPSYPPGCQCLLCSGHCLVDIEMRLRSIYFVPSLRGVNLQASSPDFLNSKFSILPLGISWLINQTFTTAQESFPQGTSPFEPSWGLNTLLLNVLLPGRISPFLLSWRTPLNGL